ncbi:MAG: hypothetical protein KKD59_02990 [Acidobacteria bacterium]|nr:hypothetical protein [Acidobacteriota bacterium]
MEQILPFEDPEDPFDDPITVANDLFQEGQFDEAYRMMEKLLVEDLRCLDAHAHLGNWLFNRAKGPQSFSLEKSRKHYEVGVRIGELSFPGDENIVLPWGRIDNRPYLRCLHGYGLALWRMGEAEEARRQFERMLWFNPSDNQGARFLLMDMDEGKPWDEVEWCKGMAEAAARSSNLSRRTILYFNLFKYSNSPIQLFSRIHGTGQCSFDR